MVFADCIHSVLLDEDSVFFEHFRDVLCFLVLVVCMKLHTSEADKFCRLGVLGEDFVDGEQALHSSLIVVSVIDGNA